ncbi:unnamed protein product [Schistocephalus solidus]|uniref:Rhomboid domain-containing protein n=1 Tax=Schistocephalus solidus TaxID=70667 RepID=A0A183SFD6_SCHSO|nr:unnamed protein product [Schistocephalus solidus]
MLPMTGSLKWTRTMTWICRLPYQKPSRPCSRFPAVKHRDPTQSHRKSTMQQISGGRAPRSDVIPPEVYKVGGLLLLAGLTTLFQELWHQGQVPQGFKDAIIIHLY